MIYVVTGILPLSGTAEVVGSDGEVHVVSAEIDRRGGPRIGHVIEAEVSDGSVQSVEVVAVAAHLVPEIALEHVAAEHGQPCVGRAETIGAIAAKRGVNRAAVYAEIWENALDPGEDHGVTTTFIDGGFV